MSNLLIEYLPLSIPILLNNFQFSSRRWVTLNARNTSQGIFAFKMAPGWVSSASFEYREDPGDDVAPGKE